MHSEWTGSSQDAASYCVDQYNRVLRRLGEIDPDVSTVFEPLPPGSSLIVAAMACKQVAAFFEDEIGRGRPFGPGRGFAFGGGPFKEFWRESAQDIEDLGEFIRESIDEWARKRRKHGCGPDPKPTATEEPSSAS